MIKKMETNMNYLVEKTPFSSIISTEKKSDKSESKKYNISIQEHNKKYNIGSIEIKLQNNINSQIKDFKDGMFKWILFLLSFAFFQTIVLLGIVYCLERLGIFGFFFALVLISDLTVEFFRTRLNDLLN